MGLQDQLQNFTPPVQKIITKITPKSGVNPPLAILSTGYAKTLSDIPV
jgi:hypothetical protein